MIRFLPECLLIWLAEIDETDGEPLNAYARELYRRYGDLRP